MEKLQNVITHSLDFWYLAGMMQLKSSFWNTTPGRFVLALMPAVVTAILTALVTVFSIYLSMREDMLILHTMVTQVVAEHKIQVTHQDQVDARLREAEKEVSRINGMLGRRP